MKYGIWGFISRKAGNLDALLTMPNNHFTDLLMPFLMIFGEIGRTASEEVILVKCTVLVKSKCLPIYGLEMFLSQCQ